MNAHRLTAALVLIGAAMVGGVVGVGSVTAPRARAVGAVRDLAVASGVVRRRPPQPGDHWNGCDDARAAGTAPIYRDEPGYRTDMDGDDDGEACEPIRG